MISSTAMPFPRLQVGEQLQDLRLDGDVERGRRLVGDQQLRRAGERHRDHDALAHAAGELVRVGVEALRRGGDAHELHQLERPRLRAAGALMPRCCDERLRDLEADRQHRVEARHRLLEDHADARRRASPACRPRRPPSCRPPSTTMRPAEMRPMPAGSSPMIDSAVRLLPQPDSPTSASVSLAAHLEADVAHGVEPPAGDADRRGQPLDRDRGGLGRGRRPTAVASATAVIAASSDRSRRAGRRRSG